MYRRLGDSFGNVSTIDGTCTRALPEPKDEDEEDDEDEGSQEGDLDAAEALQVRFRRDAGLDELGHTDGAQESLALACRYPPHLRLEEACIATVEHLAGLASADGVPLPPAVLEWVERVTEQLRRDACAASTGRGQHRLLIFPPRHR